MPLELSELLFTRFRSGMRVEGVDGIILYLDSQLQIVAGMAADGVAAATERLLGL